MISTLSRFAFEYVWQQLLNETIVNLSEKIHMTGKCRTKGFLKTIQDKTNGILPGIQLTMAIAASVWNNDEVPTEISSAFDISFLEYDALTSDNKINY
jgi:hypothetical protein